MSSPLKLDVEAAMRAAKAIGEPGQAVQNLDAIISQTQAALGDIGPEILKQGISVEEAIAAFAKGPDVQDAQGIGNIFRALINQRRALGTRVPGTQAQRGQGGGLSIYQDQQDNQLFAE